MFPSQELSDNLTPWVVPVVCAVFLALWIGSLLQHIRQLKKENARLREIVVKHQGVDIFEVGD